MDSLTCVLIRYWNVDYRSDEGVHWYRSREEWDQSVKVWGRYDLFERRSDLWGNLTLLKCRTGRAQG